MKQMSMQKALSYFELNIANIPNIGNNQSINSMHKNLAKFKEVIKKAYRKAALKNHPDVGGDEERMKIINQLYISFMNLKVIPAAPSPVFVRTYRAYSYTANSSTTATSYTNAW